MTDEQIVIKLTEHNDRIKSLEHRMKDCEDVNKRLLDISENLGKMASNMEYMADEQKKQGERLELLEHQPIDDFKHYKRTIIGCILTGVVTLVLGALLGLIIK